MTLQSSGSISLSDINVELRNSSTQIISLNDSSVRTLLNVPSGTISLSDAYGKSNRVQINYIISSNSQQLSLNPTTFTNYIAGKSDITITVNSGVYVWSDSTSVAGLIITDGLVSGDTLKLVNNGYIIGKGGKGGNGINAPNTTSAGNGGPALSIFNNITIDNLSYIAGGGGGGGGNNSALSDSSVRGGGGGGAGGGDGGNGANSGGFLNGIGGSGGSVGNSGANGGNSGIAGGGGGRILPGNGGGGGAGGGAGGGGGRNFNGFSGGSSNNSGQNATGGEAVYGNAAGGGGWGASGGYTNVGWLQSGGTGGKAINLNGYSVTYITTGNVWGAVS
jgi:hypothetical protein